MANAPFPFLYMPATNTEAATSAVRPDGQDAVRPIEVAPVVVVTPPAVQTPAAPVETLAPAQPMPPAPMQAPMQPPGPVQPTPQLPPQPTLATALKAYAPLLIGVAAIAAIGIGFWYLYKKQNEQRRTTEAPQPGQAALEAARTRATRRKKIKTKARAFPARVVPAQKGSRR